MMNLQLDYSNLKQIVLEAAVIVCLGMAVGLSFNYQMVMNAFEGKIVAVPVPEGGNAAESFPTPVSLAEVQAMNQAILVDARISELYAAGHLPTALSLPYAEAESHLDDFSVRVPKNRSLILYCSGYGCSDSFDLGVLLLQLGYNDVMVFEGGFPEWRDAGLPLEKGAK
jgi:rhodanese-related sulfurtransferase